MAKKSKKKAVRRTSNGKAKVINFLHSDSFAQVRAVCYFLLAIFLLVSIISFFITGEMDKEANWMGYVGGALAELAVMHTFGIASFGYSLILISLSLHLFRITSKHKRYDEGLAPQKRSKVILPLAPTIFCTLFWMAWLSCTGGYIDYRFITPASDIPSNFPGTFGHTISNLLKEMIGKFVPILQIFLAGFMLVFVHHVRLPKFNLQPKEVVEEEEPKEEEDPIAAAKPNLIQRLLGKKNEEEEMEEEEPDEEDGNDEDHTEFIAPDPIIPSQPDTPKIVKFDINDEFTRINQHAQGSTPDPTFTVIDSSQGEQATNETTSLPDVSTATGHMVALENGQLVNSETGEVLPPYDPKLDLKDFQMPTIDMLENWERKNTRVTKEELIENKDRIVTTLANYGIKIDEIAAIPGPTVTLYEIKPAPGVKISKIKNLEDDIALSLAALGIRIIAPIPGKGAVGIEVPNTNPQIVSMKTMLSSEAFRNTKYELPVAIGKTISNEPFIADLAKMPHLLMAGATGTGKSVGLNAVITSLLFKKHPAELKFVMVDPKKVELSLYSKIERHYLAKLPDSDEAIITDVKKVVRTLNSLCIEMDQRYDLLKLAQVKKITEYNDKFTRRVLNPEKGHRFLPYIVLVIDEFADLIMTAGKEIELPICRLAQLARAVGIHLIIATQRPTTNIITGSIKTNFPARIAFRVTSVIDSRTILDSGGANQLIGRGDMLISLSGTDMVRLQCALIETEEIDKIADYIGQQRGYTNGFLLPEYLDENEEPNKDFDPRQKDDMFNDAARLVVASQFGSTSLLQRKLQLGYNRAGRIVDQLEAAGIVGPYNGSKARDVLVKDEVTLEEILRNI